MDLADLGFFAIAPDQTCSKNNNKEDDKYNLAFTKHGCKYKAFPADLQG